jgi:hypothetical protein
MPHALPFGLKWDLLLSFVDLTAGELVAIRDSEMEQWRLFSEQP